jgi:Chaperone of endosialidase
MGTDMKEDNTQPLIELDPRELLGLSQVAEVSGKQEDVGRVLSKVGFEGLRPPSGFPLISRLLSKIGGEGPLPTQSDIRLKTDIRQVGTTAHNLPLYTFRYIGKDGQYEGVMAQDVLKVMPLAVSVGQDGYYRVDYDMLGIAMRRLD